MPKLFLNFFLLAVVALSAACAHEDRVELSTKRFGLLPDGRPVEQFTLRNPKGIEVQLLSYGGIVTSVKMPDNEGVVADVVLGFSSLPAYLKGHPYFGCITGRVANRIAEAQFDLEGRNYKLAANNNRHHLHGGVRGFDKQVWSALPFRDERGAGVVLTRRSVDGEEGYPGNLDCEVLYRLTSNNDFEVEYTAVSDRSTLVNLTHHSYFNLAGRGASGGVLGHELMLRARRYTPVDSEGIPSGALATVVGTAFDFSNYHTIGERIAQVEGGYDINYVLDTDGRSFDLAAVLLHRKSGRSVEVWTDQPGLQLYTGNFLDGTLSDGATSYEKHGGVCLEAQRFPDAPHKAHFPSIVLDKGDVYRQRTVYKFRVR